MEFIKPHLLMLEILVLFINASDSASSSTMQNIINNDKVTIHLIQRN